MPNLLVEYLKRHNGISVPLCHNGVCFFEHEGRATLVALTSLACRPFSTCSDCAKDNGSVIVELFVPGFGGSFYQTFHEHVPPQSDLLTFVNKFAKSNMMGRLTPVFAKNHKELEVWLWKFITHDTNLRLYRCSESDPELANVEPMAWAAIKQPQTYQMFYIAHEALLLNRKYLLLDN